MKNSNMRFIFVLLGVFFYAIGEEWPARVIGWKAPLGGEHPRLIFRKEDIPLLRQKAMSRQGKDMIAYLKVLLGGGDSLPSVFPNDPPVNNVIESNVSKWPVGTFTVSHSVGFGFLYVLTGDKKYAELARQCLDKVFEGQVDRDSRYNWTTPGTGFRLSFVLQSICLTYDFCYDAWSGEYRKEVINKVLNMQAKKVDKPKTYTLEVMAKADGYPPGSNHYGAYLLGPGLVALTFMGDPGSDDKRLKSILEIVEKNLRNLFGNGFGDHGWFAEGISCGRIAANCGVLPLIQSLKIAAGKDYISSCSYARYTVLRLMYEIVPNGEGINEKAGKTTCVPLIPHRGDYGDNFLYKRPIISHMGDFALGMGAVLPREAEAMKWIYDNFVENTENKTWNSGFYPHLLVYAFVNWPANSRHPEEVFSKVLVDDIHGYYIARNRWKDKDDIVVTTLLKRGPSGYKSGQVPTGTVVWGLGEKFNLGVLKGRTKYFRKARDGSMELADESGNAIAIDYSSSIPMIVTTGTYTPAGKNLKARVLNIMGTPVTVVTMSTTEHPEPIIEGNKIIIKDQIFTVEDGKIVISKFTPEK